MAEDDIYRSKRAYENLMKSLPTRVVKPKGGNKIYYCRNPKNLAYFQKLITNFEVNDISYIRRGRVLQELLLITMATKKDLAQCTRDDVNEIVAFMHTRYKSVESKKEFIKNIKFIWRVLFPELDQLGRIDDTITPYPVRHLSRKIDKSKEKLRNDRFNFDEFQRIIKYFEREPRVQAYLMLAFESLGRPQEILFTKVKDYEFYDSYAKVWISEHGKEGTGFLQSIDSYPYLQRWFQVHPLRDNPNAFFFLNEGREKYKQMTNNHVNKKLKRACRNLGIDKQISCYSLKRNGITFRRLRGDSDVQIQHTARWTSTKQLKVYDMSNQEDALRMELIKRGIVSATTEVEKQFQPKTKICAFCGISNGFTAEFCVGCKRPLNREKILEIAKKHEMLMNDDMIEKVHLIEKKFNDLLKLSF